MYEILNFQSVFNDLIKMYDVDIALNIMLI